MNMECVMKILDIQQAAREDPAYQELLAEYEPIHRRFLQLLEDTDPQTREILMDYLGITGAMHLRLMALAVER